MAWRFNPFTQKLDYYEPGTDGVSPDLAPIYAELATLRNSSYIPEYVVGTMYDKLVNNYVVHGSTTYKYINDNPSDTVTPGTNNAYWLAVYATDLSHIKNQDTKLAAGTTDEVLASDIREFIDKSFILTSSIVTDFTTVADDTVASSKAIDDRFNAAPASITQEIRSGETATSPSEDAIYTALDAKLDASDTAVTARLLTGLSVLAGGSIASTDTIINAFGKIQNQLNTVVTGMSYRGTWDAATNDPTIESGVGHIGDVYRVATTGTTEIDGISDWQQGDYIVFNGTTYDKWDATDNVSSVNGKSGTVVLTTLDIEEDTNLYFTNTRALEATLTGFASGAGAVSSTDTILQAIQKLDGNITDISDGLDIYLPLAGGTMTGNITMGNTLIIGSAEDNYISQADTGTIIQRKLGDDKTYVKLDPTQLDLGYAATTSGHKSMISMYDDGFDIKMNDFVLSIGSINKITDDNLTKGLEYAADYSANFTDHSLITQKYLSDTLTDFEETANKVTDFTDADDVKYPSALATQTLVTDSITESLGVIGVQIAYTNINTFNKSITKIIFPAYDLATPTPNELTFAVELSNDDLIKFSGAKDKEYLISAPSSGPRTFTLNSTTYDWGIFTAITTIPANETLRVVYGYDEVQSKYIAKLVKLESTREMYTSDILKSTADNTEITNAATDETKVPSIPFLNTKITALNQLIDAKSNSKLDVEKILDLSTALTPTATGYYIADTITTIHASYNLAGALKDDLLKFTLSTGLWSIYLTAANLRAIYASAEYHVFNNENGYDYFYDKKNLSWKISNEAKKPSKLVTVDVINGVDRANYGSRHLPQKTLPYGVNQIDNGGQRIELLPGTYQTSGDTLVLSKLNSVLTAVGTVGGNTLVQGTVNITATGSSTVGIAGISIVNLVHSGTSNAYVHNGFVTTSFSKTSNNYFEAINVDMGGSNSINITGAGSCVFYGGKTGVMVINNAGALVGVNGTISSFNVTLQNGILNLNNCTIYSLSNSAFALTTSANTIVKANNCFFKNLDGTDAKLSINGQWILNNCEYDKVNSVFGVNNVPLNSETKIDQLNVNAGVKSQWINVTYNSSFKVPFPTGATVYNTDGFYMTNGPVPVGTTWAIGTTGATWKKIAEISSGGSSATNLTTTLSATNVIIESDTGTDATIPLADGTSAGVSINNYTTAEKTIVGDVTTNLSGKQAILVSGDNIKTINGETLLGSGDIVISGGASSKLMKHQVKGYVDVSSSFEPSFDGKYVVKGKATINATVFPTLLTSNNDDIWELSSSVWTRILDITTLTESGETQVFFEGDDSPRYYSLISGWNLFFPDEYETVTVTGAVMPFFGGNRTFESNSPVFKQSSIGTVTIPAAPTAINADGYQEVESVVEADRCIVLSRKPGNTLDFKSGTINVDGTITFGTAISLGTAFSARIFKSPTGGIVVVQSLGSGARTLDISLYVWNNTTYVQAGATVNYDTGGVGINSFVACMNANNTLELVYNIQGGACKFACVFVGAGSLTKYTEEQFSASNTTLLGMFTFGTVGRSVLFYKNSNILTAKGYNRNTNGTRTFDASEVSMPTTNNNQEFLQSSARNGDMILTYQYNNATYCRWLNGNNTQFTMTGESFVYASHLYMVPALGGSATVGAALLNTSANTSPQAIGFVKNGDSISLAFPSTVISNGSVLQSTNGASISFDNVNFIYSFVSTLSNVYSSKAGVLSYNALPEVVSDFVFLDAAQDGGTSRIARNNQVVKDFPNVQNGQLYYFNAGLITTTPTKIVAGLGGVDGLILDIVDNTALDALTTVVNNHTDNLAGKSVQIADHENRITALEDANAPDTYAFPDYTIGFGTWFFRGEGGALPMPYAGGSNDSNRWFGQGNEGRVSQYPYFTNGKNIKIKSWEQAQSNGRNAIMIGRDANGKGYLFMAGNNNSWGQWANTSLTSDANRNGKFILIDNSEIYGATKSVFSAFIPLDKWGNDSNRDAIVCCVYDSSTGVYTNYAWGFASESSGDTWRIYPLGAAYATSPQAIGIGKLISCDLGVYGAYYSIYESESVPGRLYYCGFYTSGTYYTGTASTSNLSVLTQCLYANNTPIIDCKEIQTMREGTIGAQMQIMKRYNNETYSCGYNVYGVLGTGNAVNTDKFTRTAIPSPSNNLVSKYKLNKRVSFFLDTLGNLWVSGTNYDFIKTSNTPVFTKGVVTSVINGSGAQTINEISGTPTIIASNVENFWTRSQQTAGNSILIYKESTTKKCFIQGYIPNIGGIDDLATWGTFANYKRQLLYGDDVNNSEWEFIDFMFNGQITDANEYYVSLTAIVKNNVSGKTKLVRTGYFHTLTGITGDFESSILMRRWIDVSF